MTITTITPDFDKPRHVKFWKRCSTLLPEEYTTGDGARISLGFFVVAALDLLGVLESDISQNERQGWIDWIYSCQADTGGFRGFPGTNLGSYRNDGNKHWDVASLANSYLAILSLLVLGDDLSRFKRKECLLWLKNLQRENGSFGDFCGEGDSIEGKDDLRQCYCAAGISYILQDGMNDFETPIFDEPTFVSYIFNCQDHDGGFGQAPLREAHSGVNYCAIAAFSCLDLLHEHRGHRSSYTTGPNIDVNVTWMLHRQTTWVEELDNSSEDGTEPRAQANCEESGYQQATSVDENSGLQPQTVGFNGRCGKIADTCYCFWNIGALVITHKKNLIELDAVKKYLVEKVQPFIGGFSKVPDHRPDLLHSYLGLTTLALHGDPGLKPLDATFCVSSDVVSKMKTVCWRKQAGRP